MSKVLQCPHYVSFDGITRYCMNGRFPCDCETCNCPDRHYVDVYTTTNTSDIKL